MVFENMIKQRIKRYLHIRGIEHVDVRWAYEFYRAGKLLIGVNFSDMEFFVVELTENELTVLIGEGKYIDDSDFKEQIRKIIDNEEDNFKQKTH